MLGTYVLSAGYMDAYYNQALRVRTRIIEGFAAAYARCDVLLGPTAPTTAFALGAKVDDPLTMYLSDVCTIPSNLAGHPAISVPFGPGDDGLPGRRAAARPGAVGGHPVPGGGRGRGGRPAAGRPPPPDGGAGMRAGWQLVIGLEVHCELKTATKLFCGCPNAFGDEPNTNVCPNCLGLPGSLPVLNQRAVELAMAIGTALHCDIRPSTFHRKNYFYPDQAKDYQISQYDEPINVDGHLDLPDGFRVGIERAHMEEDTGKTTHAGASGRIHGADYSLVDYNRSGVPLVEIVSAPDMRTADQARAYVTELRAILVASGASDGKMEEGSMRVDANVSVRRGVDDPFGTRCEIKNLNSVRSLGRAIEYEAERQIALHRVGRGGGPADPPLGRGGRPHPGAALQGGRLRLPVLPRARPRAAGARRRVDPGGGRHPRDDAGRAPGPAGRPARRRRAAPPTPSSSRWPPWSTWASTTWWWRRWPAGSARPWPWPARPTRRPPTPTPPAGLDPKAYVELLTLEANGEPVGHPGQGRPGRAVRPRRGDPAAIARDEGLRGHVRGLAGRHGGRGGRPPIPTSGPATARVTTSWPASSPGWS